MNRPHPTRIAAVDLFCGVGGLTHGLTLGGIDVRAGVDVDLSCKFSYEENNSAKFVDSDVEELTTDKLSALYRDADVTLLAGCAPCQPFSTYSQSGRNSNYEEQWPLVEKFGKLVSDFQPDLVTMENVPQLLKHSVFQSFLSHLEGYSVWYNVVDCAKFGIPQTRKRLVLLASRHGEEKLELVESHPRPATVRDTIAALPNVGAGQYDAGDRLHTAASLSALNQRRIRASRPGGTWRDWSEDLLAACHKKTSGETYPGVYGRMEWDKPSPTITTQSFGFGNGRFGHPEQDRAITLREAAMLQTFPKNYKFVKEGDPVRFHSLGRLIGNAVPVHLGKVIGEALRRHAEAAGLVAIN